MPESAVFSAVGSLFRKRYTVPQQHPSQNLQPFAYRPNDHPEKRLPAVPLRRQSSDYPQKSALQKRPPAEMLQLFSQRWHEVDLSE